MTARSALAALLVLLLGGCSSAPVASSVPPAAAGTIAWPMYGGGEGRTNSADAASLAGLAPPLERAWEYDAGAGFGPASVTVSVDAVYIGTLAGELKAVDLATGEERHGEDLGEAVFGAPALSGGVVFAALSISGENLVAFDTATWEQRWAVETGDIESSPLLAGGMLVAALVDGTVAAFDTSDGAERWFYHFPATRGRAGSRSAPSSDGERVFTSTDEGEIAALRLSDGEFLWAARAGGAVFGTLPVAGGRVYAATLAGTVRAFDAATGATIWTAQGGDPIFGAPAVSAGAVIVGTSGGELRAFRPSDGSLLWSDRCAGGVGAAPLIAGGFVYAGDLAGQLSAFDLATGAPVWKENVGGRIRATPVAAGGKLIVLAEDHSVICFVRQGTAKGNAEQ